MLGNTDKNCAPGIFTVGICLEVGHIQERSVLAEAELKKPITFYAFYVIVIEEYKDIGGYFEYSNM